MAGVQEIVDCMISSWYSRFERVTFKTIIVPLPQPILDWLVSDGLHIAADSQAFAKRGPLDAYATEDDYQEWASEDEASEGGGTQPPPPELAELQWQLEKAIEQLGGRVVPKLSWSCPKDAVWISPTSSLCCTNADEVLLLLRSSDRVAHDICHALQDAGSAAGAAEAAGVAEAGSANGVAAGTAAAGPLNASSAATNNSQQELAGSAGEGRSSSSTGGFRLDDSGAIGEASQVPQVQHCLALRRWYDLQPGREFRCFVKGQHLVGASQRDVTQCYDFLREERRELAAAIQAFHCKHIQGRFPHPRYAYDVYVATSGAVRLLDFNPWGGTTAPLLFTWEELLAPHQLADEDGARDLARPGAPEAAPGAWSAAAAQPEAGAAGVAARHAGASELSRGAGCQKQPPNVEAEAPAPRGGNRADSGSPPPSCQACCNGHRDEGTQAASTETDSGVEASYLEQLRRVQAFSLEAQQQQPEKWEESAATSGTAAKPAEAPGIAPEAAAASAAMTPAAASSESALAAASPPAAAAAAAGEVAVRELDLRIIEEPVAMRPHTLAYGVPFDFVDSSEGSALERLMAQTQAAGAGELWQALAAQTNGDRHEE